MKMDIESFKMILQVILAIITIVAIPMLRKLYIDNTNKNQRKEVLFWLRFAIKQAEQIYKMKGAGALKKADVLGYLKKIGFNFDDEQLGLMIDLIVEEYNKNGWGNLLDVEEIAN